MSERFILTEDGRMYRDTLTNQDFRSPTPADTIWDIPTTKEIEELRVQVKRQEALIKELKEKLDFLTKNW